MEFSSKLDVSPSTVNLIENNLFELSSDYVDNVADILLLNSNDYNILLQLYNGDTTSYRRFILDKLLQNLGEKNPINAIRVPLELKLSKPEWETVLTHFNENIL